MYGYLLPRSSLVYTAVPLHALFPQLKDRPLWATGQWAGLTALGTEDPNVMPPHRLTTWLS